jgi:hypothetical protein
VLAVPDTSNGFLYVTLCPIVMSHILVALSSADDRLRQPALPARP